MPDKLLFKKVEAGKYVNQWHSTSSDLFDPDFAIVEHYPENLKRGVFKFELFAYGSSYAFDKTIEGLKELAQSVYTEVG